jgi:copper chaperone NosL
MQRLLERANRFFDSPIDLRGRIVIIVTTLALLLPTYGFPLWRMEMYSNQYPEGLRLYIYSYKLDAGNNGNDLREINTLNHYIGMKPLDPADFNELKWLPFMVGIFVILAMRCAVLGKVTHLVDQWVLFSYFAGFAALSFAYRMYMYGHSLDPMAAVKVQPFTPPLFGHHALANFEVYSYPSFASYCLAIYPAFLLLALYFSYRASRASIQGD